MRAAVANRAPVEIRGSGSKAFYGVPRYGRLLDTRCHGGILDYQPTELVLTARCGTPIAEIESALAERGQFLAFEPPCFSSAATLGGAVASGLSGPGRATRGALRDFVLGVTIIDGRAQLLTFGGQVMKNVAGYDVARLFAGSLGSLGVILDVSLKVLPRPVASATLQFELDQPRAIDLANRLAGQPIPLTASAWQAGVLSIRLEGAASAVDAACARLGGRRLAASASQQLWTLMRDQTDDFFAGDRPLWRLSLPPTTEAFSLDDEPLIEWGGALRWYRSEARADEVFALARARGGHATLFRAAAPVREACGVFSARPPALAQIEERLKYQFDPECLFNPETPEAALA